MISLPNENDILPIIDAALKEDIGDGDVTSEAIFTGADISTARVISRQDGIFCGGGVVKMVYRRVDPDVRVSLVKSDGERIARGETAFMVSGRTAAVLTGERTALNFAQRMSGIATGAGRAVKLVAGTTIRILDTRKTAPGLRLLDKYAVAAGGGTNHRMGLFDMVMIKDNHIRAAGGIAEAVRRVRMAHGARFKVEVEVTTTSEAREAADAGADIIMLDNMERELMREAIEIIGGRSKIEVSGNMDEGRIRETAELAIDFISIGALTHSVRAFDLSMRFE
ncbi:MAG TPA: carboxylating nicotinate-nucleotide diphosphorylase [Spirochaetota bacterium]|nr:carboxylating nicotinate-nucleotide diphosphorylase [Spirochaetota bacterium]